MAGSRWARIDTGYLRNPKVASVSRDAVLLHLASVLFSVEQLTDGRLSEHVLPSLAGDARLRSASDGARRAAELTSAGLWVANGHGWRVHDFDEMQPQAMRERVEHERERWRERQSRRRS